MLQTEIESKVADCIINMLNNYNISISQDQFYRMNIVDSTDVSEEDMRAVNDEVIQYCKDNGAFAALPPFEEGAFIDREERRYTHWKVLDVEEDYFRISMDHYLLLFKDSYTNINHENVNFSQLSHKCWYLACHVIVKVKVLTKEEHMAMLKYHPDLVGLSDDLISKIRTDLVSDLIRSSCHVGGIIEEYEFYLPKDLQKIVKKGKYFTSDGAILNGT